MLKLSFEARRWIVIVSGILYAPILLNWIAGGGWFGANDRTVAQFAFLPLILIFALVGPTGAEMRRNNAVRTLRERRRKKS